MGEEKRNVTQRNEAGLAILQSLAKLQFSKKVLRLSPCHWGREREIALYETEKKIW